MVTSRAIIYSNYGDPLSEIKVHQYTISDPVDDEVLLQSVAAPINPSDLIQIAGIYPSRPPMDTSLGTKEPSAVAGNEGLFKIIKVGSKVKDFKIGDWCIPLHVNTGTWRTYSKTAEDQLIKIPKNYVSMAQATTVSVNGCTALQLLTTLTDVKPGEWVIQNGSNSVVGKFVIQIAKKMGIKTLNVVRNRPNIEELKKKLYDLGATKVITEDENTSPEFESTIKEWTKGSIIKLGLNCIGGDSATGVVSKVSPEGVFVTYGAMILGPVKIPIHKLTFENVKCVGYWVTENAKKDINGKIKSVHEALKLMHDGVIGDIDVEEKVVHLDNLTDEEFLQIYKNAFTDSKKLKQLVVYK
ncbi:hypothetical protein PACTADRAFT_51008 [Pachysolen tannophilus NRRL Y-2460]|uniref:enoyl-[acyl-carrier-protein] reductase n=1 Tax=Pachysolen tannophilus NRRL Y-2460 TaxID=669874 RepID=A0A1E4TQT4_PACTA|nr:hypothetical protein PACTADRAFT_51008 [Pachysolen tannophilus NRRL Y-2460]